MPVDKQLRRHPLGVDPVEARIAEVRHDERLVGEAVDVHRRLQVGCDVRDACEHLPVRHRPLQLIAVADEADEMPLVLDRILAPGSVVEAEVHETRLDEVVRLEVHDPLDRPPDHDLLTATAGLGLPMACVECMTGRCAAECRYAFGRPARVWEPGRR